MKYLKIQNNGLLDIRLLPLMGGTTKDGDQYKIGQFGTGLKYAFAYLFRNNVDFKVYIGNDEVKMSSKTEHIGNTEFEIIYIDDERTGITTKMGLDWQAWMIIRELWCNALDEGGAVREITERPSGKEDMTTFCVQLTREFQEVLANWNKYFIHDTLPLYEGDDFVIYPANQRLTLYKQGVLIYESEIEGRPVFSYDIKNARINELREFKGTMSQVVANCLSAIKDVGVARSFLESCDAETIEGKVDLNWFNTWDPAWKAAVGNKKLIHENAVDEAAKNGIAIDITNMIVVSKNLFKVLTNQFKDISALTLTSGDSGEFFESHSIECQEIVERACKTLEERGYHVHSNISFRYGFFENRDVMARVNKRTGIVYMNNIHANKSLFEVMTTVVEENEHYVTGFDDKTRAFQQHFINLFVKELTKPLGL